MNVSRKTTPVLRLMALAVLGLAASPVSADSVLTGTFGANTVRYPGYAGPLDMDALAGGSFHGTFSTDGLPIASDASAYLTSFNVTVFDHDGNAVYTFSDSNPDIYGFVQDFIYNGQELNTLNFEDQTDGAHAGLQLTFAPGFNGTGITPDPSLFNGFNGLNASSSSDLTLGWDKISIVSASAVPVPLPAPAAGGLALIAVLAGSTKLRSRKI